LEISFESAKIRLFNEIWNFELYFSFKFENLVIKIIKIEEILLKMDKRRSTKKSSSPKRATEKKKKVESDSEKEDIIEEEETSSKG